MNILAPVVLALFLTQDVESGSTYMVGGRLCDQCPPGTYLVEHCKEGDRKSQCKECPEGSYSKNQSKPCEACRERDDCPRGTIFKHSCTRTTDNQCECPEGSYWLQWKGDQGICVMKKGSNTKLKVPTFMIISLALYTVYRLLNRYRPKVLHHQD